MLESHYHVLELPVGSSKTQVKEAFHRLAKIHHPDKGGDLKKMQAITAAYAALRVSAPDTPVVRKQAGGSGSFQFRSVRFTGSASTSSTYDVSININGRTFKSFGEAQEYVRKQEELRNQRDAEIERLRREHDARVEELRRYYNQRMGGL